MQNNESHRASLRARRDAVKGEILSTLGRISDERSLALADQAHDTKDSALASLLVESGDAELQRAALELQDIDAALQRITLGTYGSCVACGVGIPEPRLSAYPTAKRCQPCQSRHEQQKQERPAS